MNPSSLELLASLQVDDGRWGDTCAPFQLRDAEAVLDASGPPFTFITRPRGGRKSTDAAGYAVALHLTAAPPGAKSYVVAADAQQAGLVLDSIRGFVRRAPSSMRASRSRLAGSCLSREARSTAPARFSRPTRPARMACARTP